MTIGYFEDEDGGALYPESVISESLTAGTIVSEHPVEGAENVQDHAQPQAATLTVEILFSETPLAVPPANFYIVGSGGASSVNDEGFIRGINGTAISAFGDEAGGFSVGADGVQEFEDAVEVLTQVIPNRDLPYYAMNWLMTRRGRRLVYYSSRFPAFRDCVITSISTVRTNRLALRITVELKQVRVAQAREVDIPPRKKRKIVDQPKITTGAQPPKTPTAQADAPFASGLAGASNFLGFSF